MKQIQFTSGCSNNCSYCYEPNEILCYDPKIPEDKEVEILDMNLLDNPNHLEILNSLPKKKWELRCGIDYRKLTPEICDLLKEKGFIKIRWAWDYNFGQQRIHQKIWRMLRKAGFRNDQLMIFILVNWKIPYIDCLRKLDLLLCWNVQVSDCCYDGGYPKNFTDWLTNPRFNNKRFWEYEDIIRFRKRSRKINQIIRSKIDVEFK